MLINQVLLDWTKLVTHKAQYSFIKFSEHSKDMYLIMFHKRGMHTDLNNWRGLMISNFTNSPMTWLNYLLTPNL